MTKNVSSIDILHYELLRSNINNFIKDIAELYDKKDMLLLDVAPQDHEGAKMYFKKSKIETLDIDPNSEADYIADLCKNNIEIIENNKFDAILLSEVLEHTLQPFEAISEIYRILKYGGYLFLTVPFNFRIHGPLPDCWRFTEHGLRELLKNFDIIKLNVLEDNERFLMPIAYTIIAQK